MGSRSLCWLKPLRRIPAGTRSGIADDQRDVQDVVKDAVMIEPEFVIVKRLAMIAVENDDRVVQYAHTIQRFKERLDAGVHISDGAIVLGDYIVFVRKAGRHPGLIEYGERFES